MDGYGKRILVVDEDAGCRALVEAQLDPEGYAVQTARDGGAGLTEMRKWRFDAVIAAGHMPGSSAANSQGSAGSRGLTLQSFSFPEILPPSWTTRMKSTRQLVFVNPTKRPCC